MAGRPGLQELNQKIEAAGGEDAVFEQIADGASIGAIMKPLGMSRAYFYTWLSQEPHAERRKRKLEEARRISAEAHAEMGAEILDDLADPVKSGVLISAPQVTLATARAKYRQWLASTRDREQFGDAKGGGVVINVGSLHLDALRVGGQVRAPAQEAELVEDGIDADLLPAGRQD